MNRYALPLGLTALLVAALAGGLWWSNGHIAIPGWDLKNDFWFFGNAPITEIVAELCAGDPTPKTVEYDGKAYACPGPEIYVPLPSDPGYPPAPEPGTGPVIDQFGPEMAFPGTMSNPGIAEIFDGANYCAVVKVNVGETLIWNGPGAYWTASSQEALDARWPHHSTEYHAKYGACSVLTSANEVPPAK